MDAKVLSNLDSKKQNLSNKRFVDKIKIISDFLEWNFSVYKKKEIKEEISNPMTLKEINFRFLFFLETIN